MLGIQNFDQNILLIFIESLQHEDEEEELCIDYRTLSQLIEHQLGSDEIEEVDSEIETSNEFSI